MEGQVTGNWPSILVCGHPCKVAFSPSLLSTLLLGMSLRTRLPEHSIPIKGNTCISTTLVPLQGVLVHVDAYLQHIEIVSRGSFLTQGKLIHTRLVCFQHVQLGYL